MKIAVKDLRPNPFRNLDSYPIRRDKVEALKQSIKQTDFWDNLLARKSPDEDGKWQMAFGHHRYVALKELGISEIDIPIRKLGDDVMLQMMAHENRAEWGAESTVEQETIRAVVEAFAEGRIELPKATKGNGPLRYAPSFTLGGKYANGDRPYTAHTIAKFLGEKTDARIVATLDTLATIEHGLIKRADLEGLSVYQAEQVARQARRVEKETGKPELARSVGKQLAGGMRSASGQPGRGAPLGGVRQAVTYHGARHVADQAIARERRDTKPREYPAAGKAIPELAAKMAEILSPESTMADKVANVVAVLEHLNAKDVKMLAAALRGIAKRANRLADKLEGVQ